MQEAGKESDAAGRTSEHRRRWPKLFGRVVITLAFAYLMILIAMLFFENLLIFIPARHPIGNWNPTGIAAEDAWFQSADGTRLHGWYVPRSKPRAVILFCHGNAGNVTHRAESMQALHRLVHASVLVFDYRGYGRSEGKPNELGILADARAARAWLAARENIAEQDIVVMGESIGGAVAVDLAARDGARALVLENTFDTLPNVAAYHFPWLPVQWAMRTRLDSVAKIGQYQGPLFQAHGDADTIVPLPCGQRLFAAANEPKTFMLLPGRDHNDGMPGEYYTALAKFLDSLPESRR